MSKLSSYRVRKRLLWIVLAVLVFLVFAACAAVFVFKVNRFKLEIVPNGMQEIVLEYGEAYSDPGVASKLYGSILLQDGVDVDARITMTGTVDTDTVGPYTIQYIGEYHGLEAKAVRTVRVIDATPPSITLKSVPGHHTILGEAYEEEGYTAYDQYDGDITDRVTSREENGFMIYTVTDSSGNQASIRRKIRYYDPIPPELTLMGEKTIYLDAGSQYSEPGFAAVDNADGDITQLVQIEGEINRYLSGTYTLYYSVSDSNGNQSTVERQVVVVAKPQPDTVKPGNQVIYLTFDDGPSQYTEQLLKVLEQYNVKATFFVVNSDYAYLIPQIAGGGHAIGIHSVTHNYSQIYSSEDAYFSAALRMQKIIQEKCGVETTLLRFPGGSSNTVSRFNPGIMSRLSQAVLDMGFQYFDWNVDSDDAGRTHTTEGVFENVVSGVEKQNFSVVLQHDTKPYSVEAGEELIVWGLSNGYTFLPLEPTSPHCHHGINN